MKIRVAFLLISVLGFAQSPAERLDGLVAAGLRATREARYAEAINALEEAVDRGRRTPVVLENLAIAHLYGERNLAKARELMKASLAAGGQATFVVRHSHQRSILVGGLEDGCAGRLSLSPSRLTYQGQEDKHSFSVSWDELVTVKKSRLEIGKKGRFTLRLRQQGNYEFTSGTWMPEEAQLLFELVEISLHSTAP